MVWKNKYLQKRKITSTKDVKKSLHLQLFNMLKHLTLSANMLNIIYKINVLPTLAKR